MIQVHSFFSNRTLLSNPGSTQSIGSHLLIPGAWSGSMECQCSKTQKEVTHFWQTAFYLSSLVGLMVIIPLPFIFFLFVCVLISYKAFTVGFHVIFLGMSLVLFMPLLIPFFVPHAPSHLCYLTFLWSRNFCFLTTKLCYGMAFMRGGAILWEGVWCFAEIGTWEDVWCLKENKWNPTNSERRLFSHCYAMQSFTRFHWSSLVFTS